MQKKKPTGKPLDPEQAEKFLAGADSHHEEVTPKQHKPENTNRYPWQAPEVREDVAKAFNLRIPEPLFLKLKFLAENIPKTSMQRICLESIEPVVEREVSALIAKMEEADSYKR